MSMSDTAYGGGYMQGLLRFIENNLSAELDTELLSGIGFSSHAKLYRSFYNLTGHCVKEYVRKRRLSNALALIKVSDIGLADIAFQCGYSSHQALCRAVKQALGLTPSEYKHGDTYYYFPPFGGEPPHPVTVLCDTLPAARRLLFYRSALPGIEDMAVRAFLRAFPGYGGRILGRNGRQDGGRFCYELYVSDMDADYGPLARHGFEVTRPVPGATATFATTTVRNDEEDISAAWDYLYSEWLQSSMFEYTDEPYYEEYLLRNGKPYRLKLYLPIRKRSPDTRITLTANPGLHFLAARADGCNAEKTASQAVFHYVSAHHPEIIRTSKELYHRQDTHSCTCGIRIPPELHVADGGNVARIATERAHYLVLESSVTGDYDRYAKLLAAFALGSGMNADTAGIFAVYDAGKSFDNLRIRMYCPVRIDTAKIDAVKIDAAKIGTAKTDTAKIDTK